MSLKVGVVCEGSHDFNVLVPLMDQMIRAFGETVGAIECLQPEVSASFQVTDGGWTQVRSWCQSDNGEKYRQYLDKPLFRTSKSYNILIIHLDGDVVSHCDSPPLGNLSIEGMGAEDIVSALRDTIFNHWLNPVPELKDQIVACIPVRHLEAWLSAALGPKVADHEALDMKTAFRSGPAVTFSGSWRDRYITAAKHAVPKIADIRSACVSFLAFEVDLRVAVEVV